MSLKDKAKANVGKSEVDDNLENDPILEQGDEEQEPVTVEGEVVEKESSPETTEEDALEEEEESSETESTSTEVSTEVASGNLPTTEGNSANQVIANMAEAGFEGLELDFSSFVGIVLNDGEFECTNGKTLGHEGFKVRITKTRKKFAFRSNHKDQKDVEVAYSYDANAHADESSYVYEKINEWKEDGAGLGETKEYLEVWAVIEDDMGDGEMTGQLVLLSIPPTSKGRLSGFLTTQQMTKGLMPSEFVTHVHRGEKVTKVDFPFYPWAFKVAD